ncbi:MAG: hypothetical protein HYV14_01630 [Elusimicrobia bacterium]|nr:hypothetical protein [Elusimicrobiota bacterium]
MASTDEPSSPPSNLLRPRRLFAAAAVSAALSLSALALDAEAATVSWTGASDGNWFNAANWSPAQVPTSADDAVIDLNATVSASGGTSIAFATLTLGDAAGNFAPTLRLSAAQSTSGSVTIHRGARLQQDTNQQIVFGALDVKPGGLLTHTANTSARSFLLNLSVTGNFDLQAGATIAANGQGYAPGVGTQNGFGPGAGVYGGDGSGAGHGGAGGRGSSGALGGGAYDNTTNPTELGSGGGGSYSTTGGAGGGAALITVGGAFSLNGLVNANGNDGVRSPQDYGSGGGAGGTVNIMAASFSGMGSVLANGGTGGAGGNSRGGGGGGGRVSIAVTGSDSSNLNLQANAGGNGGSGAANGGAGVIALKGPGASIYSLTIGGASLAAQSATPITGPAPTFASVTINNAVVTFDAGSTASIDVLATTNTVSMTAATLSVNGLVVTSTMSLTVGTLALNGGTLEVAKGSSLKLTAQSSSGGDLVVDGGGAFVQMNTAALNFTAVTVLPGGLITQAANTNTRAAVLNLNVSGNFDLQPGATVSVNGLGYAGGTANGSGYGPGAGIYGGDGSGAGHGGAGGRGSSGAGGGAAYDNVTSPTDLGSGGGSSYNSMAGGAGGGAALITVGGAFSLNGVISAGGNDGVRSPNDYGSGGGAGGTVNITAATFNGTGSILANGGAGGAGGNQRGGGGGGGRISIVVTGADNSNLNLQANGGTGGGSGAASGGAGVIALKTSGGANYNLSIGDLNSAAQTGTAVAGSTLAFSTVTLNNSIVSFDAGSTVNINNLIVAGAVNLTAATLAFNGGTLEVKSGGTLRLSAQATSGGNLIVDGGGVFQQMNAVPLNFVSINVLPGGSLTHAANNAFRSAVLNLNVAGDFNLQAGATIAANSQGYAGGTSNGSGYGPGAGIYGGDGSGGGHGGAGGRGSSGAGGGAAYDNTTSPTDLGSGGGSSYNGAVGGAGGGAVLIMVGGTFSLNGVINANGNDGVHSPYDYGSGGGAGGTVNITAATFNGTGSILANGGVGGAGGNQRGGGGGGGRVSIVVTGADGSNLNLQANGGTSGGSGAANGGAGVIALKTTGGVNYSLSIGDLTSVPQTGSGVGGAAPVFSTVTLNNSIVNFDPGSNVTINSLVVVGGAVLSGHNLSFGSAVPIQVRSGSLKVTANQLTVPTGSPIEVQGGGSMAFAVAGNSGGALIVRNGGSFQQLNAQVLSFDSVLVERGGMLTHAPNSTTRSSVLNLAVSGAFDLQAGATIALNGLGYAGGTANGSGYGPGAGIYGGDGSGAGHGGAGGRGSSGAGGGAAYDNVTNPMDLGSGGGSSYNSMAGGAGGGAAMITVGGAFSLNGVINAGGNDGVRSPYDYGSGGGAGGTVNITAATFNGTGSILANGGAGGAGGNQRGGGGAGGRIAIAVTGADGSTLTLQANSAVGGGSGAANGGAGVIARKAPSASSYNLTIGDPSVTPQSATPLAGASPTFANLTINNGVVTFDAGSTATVTALVVKGTASVTAATLAPGTLEVASGAVLKLMALATSGGLQVDGGGTFVQMNTATLGFASVSALPGSVLTHNINSNTRAAILNMNVVGDFDLQAGAAIALNGLGYAGGTANGSGFGPGAGIYGGDGSGAGHGGAGGRGSSGAGGGAAYDNATSPTDLGSGGGSSYNSMAGGAGGGAALITVGGALSLNGTINANGVNGARSPNDYGSGGGAGGTVNLTAAAFNGSGTISATGGSGGPGGNQRGGGGGGGRVALAGCNANKVTSGVSGGGAGGSSAVGGSTGTVNPTIPAGCPSAPPAPVNLAVSSAGEDASGSTFITATWDPAPSALSYTLQASTAADFSGIVHAATSAATTATILGVTPNATYFLQVAAYNIVGFSAFSSAVTTRTPADLTSPQPPSLVSASGGPGGRISLSWQAAAAGEQTTSFNLYRATEAYTSTTGLTSIQLHAAATFYTDVPPTDGTYFYAVAGLDPSFNESGISNMLSAQSLHAGPAAPSLAAVFSAAQKHIALSWTASTGTVVGYNVYRATFSASSVAGRAPLLSGTTATAFVDAPSIASDSTYYYLVTAVDPVGNEGAPSNQSAVAFDVHSPAITITGVSNGQYASANLTPAVTIADFSPYVATVSLNGQPFAGGVTLTLPGTYFLSVAASDVFANASSATASFTIDKATPTFVLLSPQNGLITNQNVPVSYQVSDDLTPAAQIVVKDELGIVVPSSYTITIEGARNLTLTARDLAGNAASASSVFILDKTPPVVVSDLRVTAKNPAAGQATLAWTSPHDALSGVAGYIVKAAGYPIDAANFDAAPTVAVSTTPRAEGAAEQFVVTVPTISTVYFVMRSSDEAGNLSAISNIAFWDLNGPVLSGLNPAPGGVVSRPANVTVQAGDLTGVAWAAFAVDGVVLSTITTAPYSFLWNTLAYADGTHSVAFNALDVLGNASSLSAAYTLAYQPPPTPVVTAPSANFTTFTATVTVAGTAEPGTTVQVLIDGFILASALTSSTGSFQTVVTLPAQGSPLMTVLASDFKGAGTPISPIVINYNLTPPGVPGNFSAASLPAGRVRLAWDAPAGKVPSFYRIYRSSDAAAFSPGVVPAAALLIKDSLNARTYDDLPAQDGVYHYAVTALDASLNQSGASDSSSAVSDRAVPTAALTFLDGVPPFGPGAKRLQLSLSKVLASPPLLLFRPFTQTPLSLALSASSPTVWLGTLTVTSAMNSGVGAFSFQGSDFVGNVGTSLTAGATALLDLAGPSGSIALVPASPVKAGTVALSLNLTEPVPVAPQLAYVTASGSTVPVTLSGAGTAWTGTLTIVPGSDGPASFAFSATDALGNVGASLTAGGSFVILTEAPGAPLFLRAIPQKAGAVRVTWSAPVGGTPASYNVYRDSVRISSGVAPLSDGSGLFVDNPADGPYVYAASAVDAAGNESPLSTAVSATAKSSSPAAPTASTATFSSFGHIEVSWEAGSADSTLYRIHRTSAAGGSFASASFSALASTPPFVDTPPQNARYFYYITALDSAGNESSPSQAAEIVWDRAPPSIVIAGVQNGVLYNLDVAPVFTATGSATAVTLSATLNAAPFVSGSTVSAEGDHTLTVNAVNQSAAGSTTTVHFTIDKTFPAVSITGIPSGTSVSPVLPQVTVTDLHLGAVTLTLDGGSYPQGTPISANGAHVFTVTAADLAGNVSVSSKTFTLNLPPSAPANFTLTGAEGAGAAFTWESPASGLAGYRFYKDGVLQSQGLLSGLQFQDAAFALGTAHVYEVLAVDASGQDGARARISVPAVDFTLDSYGVNLNGVQALTRGFFDTVRFRVSNTGAQSAPVGPAAIELVSAGATVFSGQAPSVSVPAGGAVLMPAVVAVTPDIADAPTLRATLTLPVGLGSRATVKKTFPLAARTPLGSPVELFAGPMIFGANAAVQVKFNNKGSAPMEVRTAINSDVSVSLATPQGTVLSQATLSQTGNGAQAGPTGYFVSIAPGASFLFDGVQVFVPEALGSGAVLAASISRTFNGLIGDTIDGTRAFDASQTITGVAAPAYSATISPDRPVYDQGPTVILSGEARDTADALVPGATVQVGVSVQGFVRSLSAKTDETGHYSIPFNPAPTEAGTYTLWASNPAVVSRVPQSSFTIAGFSFQYTSFNAAVVRNSTLPFTVSLLNTGQTALTDLTALVISTSGVAGVGLTLNPASVPSSLAGGQSAALSFSASATADAPLGPVSFTVEARESNGFVRRMPVTLNVSAGAPGPSADPQAFTIGMNAGQTRVQTVVLKNLGTSAWTGVSVSSSALSWVAVQGNNTPSAAYTLGDVPAGGQVQFNLVVAPPLGLASQALALNPLVTVNSTNAPALPVNALITITAGTDGGIIYNVINADKPRNQFGSGVPVPGAQVQLVSLDIAGLSFSAVVDANSVARFNSVPAGRYNLTAKAAGFSDFLGTETIQPGVTNTREVLLLTEMVSYVWSVTPTTIIDQYTMKLSMTFKTDVPAPAVIISPAVFNFNLESEGSVDAQLTVSNQGLISAFDVALLPKIDHPHLTIDMPYSTIAELKAGQTITVPIRVTLHSDPLVCYKGKIVGSGTYLAACGTAVNAVWPGPEFNANCGVTPSLIVPETTTGPALPIPDIAGVLPAAPLVTAAVVNVIAAAAPAVTGCSCSMKITGDDRLPLGTGTKTYTATLNADASCPSCSRPCALGTEWIASGVEIVSKSGCVVEVRPTSASGGTLNVTNGAPNFCKSDMKKISVCEPIITRSSELTGISGGPITLTAALPSGCQSQSISWSPASSPQGTLDPTTGPSTTFTPSSTSGELVITAHDTTAGSTLATSTTVLVAQLVIVHPTGDPRVPSQRSTTNQFVFTGANGIVPIRVEADIQPASARAIVDGTQIKWHLNRIPSGPALSWNNAWPAEPTAGMTYNAVATLTGYPTNNSDFGNFGMIAQVLSGGAVSSQSTPIQLFFDALTVAAGRTVPNWFVYWTNALGFTGQFSFDPSLATNDTTVTSATTWTIRIAPSAYWPDVAGNPPTGHRYIDGFRASIYHEFWHRDHRVHNFTVHGAWTPPITEDIDGDGICDREPTDPPGHNGGYEAMIGSNPNSADSTEVGADWAEAHGTYGNEGLDWAHPGSQWEP